jgi:hypothetical protein
MSKTVPVFKTGGVCTFEFIKSRNGFRRCRFLA